MTDTDRDELLNATRDALKAAQDARLREAAARQEMKTAKILAVVLIVVLWLDIAARAWELL